MLATEIDDSLLHPGFRSYIPALLLAAVGCPLEFSSGDARPVQGYRLLAVLDDRRLMPPRRGVSGPHAHRPEKIVAPMRARFGHFVPRR